jgi:cell wall assembly regulator SMI1
VAALAKGRRTHAWPTRGSVAFAAFDALVEASGKKLGALRRLAGPFLDAIGAHPETLGIPYGFRPAEQIGATGIPLLARAFDRGLAGTDRATIEGFGAANPMNSAGFKIAAEALARLFEYEGSEEKVAAALRALPWSDERLWLLFKILAGGYGGPFRGPKQLGGVAAAVLPELVDGTASIQGDGASKLRALLVRAKVIAKSAAGGAKAAKLPRALPIEVDAALALLDTWKLSAADVQATPAAKPREIASLEKKLGRKLPEDLAALLGAHASIGDREIGPPARMKELFADLAGTIAEHEEEGEAPSNRNGELDVRGFDPLKRGIPLGTDPSGDLYFLAIGATSGAGKAPVIRFCHDQALVAKVAADSLGEYVAMVIARVYARREGLEPQLDKIEGRRRKITAGFRRR